MSTTKYYLSALCLGTIIFLFILPNNQPLISKMPSTKQYPASNLEGNYESRLGNGILRLLANGKYTHNNRKGIWEIIYVGKEQLLILTPKGIKAKNPILRITAYGMENTKTKEQFVRKRHY